MTSGISWISGHLEDSGNYHPETVAIQSNPTGAHWTNSEPTNTYSNHQADQNTGHPPCPTEYPNKNTAPTKHTRPTALKPAETQMEGMNKGSNFKILRPIAIHQTKGRNQKPRETQNKPQAAPRFATDPTKLRYNGPPSRSSAGPIPNYPPLWMVWKGGGWMSSI